jgi:hypothetical protein
MLKTIYLEHSAFGFETWWDDLRQLSQNRDLIRFVLSDWNLIEIANGEDEVRATARAKLADEIRPLWMMERSHLLRREVQKFVYEHLFHQASSDLQPFSDSLSVMLSYHEGPNVPLGETAVLRINRLQSNRMYLAEINKGKQVTLAAQTAIRSTSPKERAAAEAEVFRKWVGEFIPYKDPDGKLLTQSDRKSLSEACFQASDKFYELCPGMFVEHSLYVTRAQDPKRNPELQDGIDFQHSVMALSYCDYLFTRDRHLAHVARSVKVARPSAIATVVATISDVKALVPAQS